MTDKQETKPSQTPIASTPTDAVGVFTKDYYCAFGCFRAGQHITRKVAKEHWDEWLRSGLVKVL